MLLHVIKKFFLSSQEQVIPASGKSATYHTTAPVPAVERWRLKEFTEPTWPKYELGTNEYKTSAGYMHGLFSS